MGTTSTKDYSNLGHNSEGSVWWLHQDGVRTKVHLHYIDGKMYFYPEWAGTSFASLR